MRTRARASKLLPLRVRPSVAFCEARAFAISATLLAMVLTRDARAEWVVDRGANGSFDVAADSMGFVPAFTVVSEGVPSSAQTRDGFLRFPKPCARVTVRALVKSEAGAALVVDEGNVHHASIGGRSLGAGGLERFSWRALGANPEPRMLEVDVEPPASTCTLRLRLPGATVVLERRDVELLPKSDVRPANLLIDSLSLLPELRTPSDDTFLTRTLDRSFFRWASGPELAFDAPKDVLALLASSRALKLDALPERSAALVSGTLALLQERLSELLTAPAPDMALVKIFADDLRRIVAPLERHVDPLDTMDGSARLGLVARIDGRAQELAVYMPPLPRSVARRYPLVVSLHGLDGRAMNFLRATLGDHATGLEGAARERLPVRKTPIDAFIVAPAAHGNSMYRGMGERAVLDAIDAMVARFPIDRDRITITGASMGGTGSASIALRHPDRFAGAMPLCGYQSYFVRRDLGGLTLHPWESSGAQARSPALHAANGLGVPFRVVHGTLDLPLDNSKVLVDAYRHLDQSVVYDQPAAGHDVWTWTFSEGHGLDWLLAQRRTPLAHFRYLGNDIATAFSQGFHVATATEPGGWFELDGHHEQARTKVVTKGIERLRVNTASLSRTTKEIVIDGSRIALEKKRTDLQLERRGNRWVRSKSAPPPPPLLRLRDVFQAPTLIMASDGPTSRLVAETFLPHRPFLDVALPIGSVRDAMPSDRTVVVVGPASDPAIDAMLKREGIVFSDHGLQLGARTLTGVDLALAVAIPGKNLVFITGHDEHALMHALALPDLLPTLVVADSGANADANPIVAGHRRYVLAGDSATLLRARPSATSR